MLRREGIRPAQARSGQVYDAEAVLVHMLGMGEAPRCMEFAAELAAEDEQARRDAEEALGMCGSLSAENLLGELRLMVMGEGLRGDGRAGEA